MVQTIEIHRSLLETEQAEHVIPLDESKCNRNTGILIYFGFLIACSLIALIVTIFTEQKLMAIIFSFLFNATLNSLTNGILGFFVVKIIIVPAKIRLEDEKNTFKAQHFFRVLVGKVFSENKISQFCEEQSHKLFEEQRFDSIGHTFVDSPDYKKVLQRITDSFFETSEGEELIARGFSKSVLMPYIEKGMEQIVMEEGEQTLHEILSCQGFQPHNLSHTIQNYIESTSDRLFPQDVARDIQDAIAKENLTYVIVFSTLISFTLTMVVNLFLYLV